MTTRLSGVLVLWAGACGCASESTSSSDAGSTAPITHCLDAGGECSKYDPSACVETNLNPHALACGRDACCFPRTCGENERGRCTFLKDACSVPLDGECGPNGAVCCLRFGN